MTCGETGADHDFVVDHDSKWKFVQSFAIDKLVPHGLGEEAA